MKDNTANHQLFAATIDEYLNNKEAIGVRFRMGNASANVVRMYIQGGVILDENREKRALHTECRFPEKKLYEFLLSQVGQSEEDVACILRKQQDYRTGIKLLMDANPELRDANLNVSMEDLFNHLYIENQPAYKAVSYILHYPKVDTNTLHHMVTTDFKPSSEANKELHSSVRDLKERMGLTPDVFCRYGADCFYFYETGKVGYATVHRDRSVKWYGEPLSQGAKNQINRVASSGNYLYQDRVFFNSRAVGRINLLMADADTGKFRDIYIQKYTDNQNDWDVLMEDGVPLKQPITENLIEMRGRIGQVQFAQRHDGVYMRCRIDGVQQMYERVKPEDYQRYQQGSLTADELAARTFVGQLLATVRERDSKIHR